MSEQVIINDVGPRDGLQNQSTILPPAQRLQLIQALVAAGLKHIEFGAFVSPKAVPAMAGAAEMAAALPSADAVNYTALIPNRKGYELAQAAGVKSMGLVVAASSTMNEKNIRMSTAQAMQVAAEVAQQAKIDQVELQIYLSTAWHCPFEGAVDAGVVSDLAARMAELEVSLIVVSDTIGAAHPGEVRSLMDRLVAERGADKLSCHFHDTRALGMADAYAALEAGIRRFDASVGGLGGCPFAPGATGNIATEDLAMMLSLMGFETGIDLDKLIQAGQLANQMTSTCSGVRSLPWLSNNLQRFSTN